MAKPKESFVCVGHEQKWGAIRRRRGPLNGAEEEKESSVDLKA